MRFLRFAFVITALSLFACASPSARSSPSLASPAPGALGHLNWRLDAATLKGAVREQSPLGRQLRGVLGHAQDDLVSHPNLAVVARFEREGILPTDPRYKASEQALHDLSILFRWALCSRVADARLAPRCKAAAESAATRWATTYVPTGNPINESDLVLLFVSLDLLSDAMSEPERAQIAGWLRGILAANDRFFGKRGHNTKVNNWNTWRLVERMFVAALLGDAREVSATRELVAAQARDNLAAPSDWAPDPACANNASEPRYGSYDFRQRDALHYHVYDLQAWTWISLLAPGSDETRAAVLGALDFIKPYFTGERQHVEFVCSKVPFDIQRREAGIAGYLNEPWKPASARHLLRLARAVFPEVRDWSASVDDPEYDPWIKTIAEIQKR